MSANLEFLFRAQENSAAYTSIKCPISEAAVADPLTHLSKEFLPSLHGALEKVSAHEHFKDRDRFRFAGFMLESEVEFDRHVRWVLIHRLQELLSCSSVMVETATISSNSVHVLLSTRSSPVDKLCKITPDDFVRVVEYLFAGNKERLLPIKAHSETSSAGRAYCAFVARDKNGRAVAMQGSNVDVPTSAVKRGIELFPRFMLSFPESTEYVNMLYGFASYTTPLESEVSVSKAYLVQSFQQPASKIRRLIVELAREAETKYDNLRLTRMTCKPKA